MHTEPKAWEELELLDSRSSHSSQTLVDEQLDDGLDDGLDDHHYNQAEIYSGHSFLRQNNYSTWHRLASWLPLRRVRYSSLVWPAHRRHAVSWLRMLLMLLAAFPTICIILILFAGIFLPSYTHAPEHYKTLTRRIHGSQLAGRGNPNNEKVFIAASIYDKQGELAGGDWGRAILDLVKILGEENVFLSIYENDPDELAKEKLDALEQRVECNSSIVTQHLDTYQLPHVTLQNGEQRLKRIAFLAEVRNRALLPLDDPTSPAFAVRFDKLLYINDIMFKPADAANLLFSTKIDLTTGRTQYRSACATDFIMPFKFYDTFASRDLEGYSMGIPFFPWFTASGKGQSRRDVLSQTDAVRVRSCWGGMIAFEAKWFQHSAGEGLKNLTASKGNGVVESDAKSTSTELAPTTTTDFHPELDKNLNWGLATPNIVRPAGQTTAAENAHDGNLNWHWTDADTPSQPDIRSLDTSSLPLRFRANTDVYWDSSECCLINADLQTVAHQASSNGTNFEVGTDTGVYLNPYIRVAYDSRTLSWLGFIRRFERLYSPIHWILNPAVGLPGFNPRRTEQPGDVVTDRVWTPYDPNWQKSGNLSGSYRDVPRTALPGGFCGGRKLLVLDETADRGSMFQSERPPEDPALVSGHH